LGALSSANLLGALVEGRLSRTVRDDSSQDPRLLEFDDHAKSVATQTRPIHAAGRQITDPTTTINFCLRQAAHFDLRLG